MMYFSHCIMNSGMGTEVSLLQSRAELPWCSVAVDIRSGGRCVRQCRWSS